MFQGKLPEWPYFLSWVRLVKKKWEWEVWKTSYSLWWWSISNSGCRAIGTPSTSTSIPLLLYNTSSKTVVLQKAHYKAAPSQGCVLFQRQAEILWQKRPRLELNLHLGPKYTTKPQRLIKSYQPDWSIPPVTWQFCKLVLIQSYEICNFEANSDIMGMGNAWLVLMVGQAVTSAAFRSTKEKFPHQTYEDAFLLSLSFCASTIVDSQSQKYCHSIDYFTC